MHADLNTQVAAIEKLINELTPKELAAKEALDSAPDNEALKLQHSSIAGHIKDLREMSFFMQDQIGSLQNVIKTNTAPTETIQHSASDKTMINNVPAPTNSIITSTKSQITLKSPKPYAIGDDFEIFFELFKSFSEGETYFRRVQILKTLLSPEAYKISKHVFDDVHDLENLEKGLNPIFSKSTNLTSAIHAFRLIKQNRDETAEAFATRIRICAAEAFPSCSQKEREPYMVQMFVQGLNVSQQQKNLLNLTEHNSLSDTLIVAARLIDDVTEIHSVETTVPNKVTVCNYCKKTGHIVAECRTRLRHQTEQARMQTVSSCTNCGARHAAAECRQPPKTDVICFLCQKRGHFSRQCRSAANAKVLCQLCQKPGHVALQCRTVKFSSVKSAPEPNFLSTQHLSNRTDAIPSDSPFQGNGTRLA